MSDKLFIDSIFESMHPDSVDEDEYGTLTEEECIQYGLFDEKSHGKKQFDFRKAFDWNTGHALKIVYDLANIEVVTVGSGYTGYDPAAKQAQVDYLNKNIKRVGNGDHASKNQKVLKIIDRVNGDSLPEAEVFGPFSNPAIHQAALIQPKEVLDELRKDADWVKRNVYKIKLGEVDTTPRFKSTHWFKDSEAFYKDANGNKHLVDTTIGRGTNLEALKDLSMGSAKLNDIPMSGKGPVHVGERPEYAHPSRRDIRDDRELYIPAYRDLNEYNRTMNGVYNDLKDINRVGLYNHIPVYRPSDRTTIATNFDSISMATGRLGTKWNEKSLKDYGDKGIDIENGDLSRGWSDTPETDMYAVACKYYNGSLALVKSVMNKRKDLFSYKPRKESVDMDKTTILDSIFAEQLDESDNTDNIVENDIVEDKYQDEAVLSEAASHRVTGEEVRDGYLGDLPEKLRVDVMNAHKMIVQAARDEFRKSKYNYLNTQSWAKNWLDQFLTEPSDHSAVGSVRLYKRGKRYRCMIQVTDHIPNTRNTEDEEFFHGFIRNVHTGVRSKIRRKFDMTLSCESEHGEPYEGFDLWTKQKMAKELWESMEDKKSKVVKESADGVEYMMFGLEELPNGLQNTILEASNLIEYVFDEKTGAVPIDAVDTGREIVDEDEEDIEEDYSWLSEELCDDLGIDYFDEKQHSNLKVDHRIAMDADTGHKLHVIYSLDGMVLDANNVENHERNGLMGTGPDAIKDLKKYGNTDHCSHNQKVLAIIDMETGENIKDRVVKTKGPYNDNTKTIKVGEIDNSPTYKSTFWGYGKNNASILSARGGIMRMRGVKGHLDDPGDPVHIKKLYGESYEFDDIGYTLLRRDVNGLVEGFTLLTPEFESLDESDSELFESVWEDCHDLFESTYPSKSMNLVIGDQTYFEMGMDPDYAGMLWDYMESSEPDYITEEARSVAFHVRNFKRKYNWRPIDGYHANLGLITVEGKDYYCSIQTHPGQPVWVAGFMPGGSPDFAMVKGHDVVTSAQRIHGASNGTLILSYNEFLTPQIDIANSMLHEIGHLNLHYSNRNDTDARNDTLGKIPEEYKKGIHGNANREIEADAYAIAHGRGGEQGYYNSLAKSYEQNRQNNAKFLSQYYYKNRPATTSATINMVANRMLKQTSKTNNFLHNHVADIWYTYRKYVELLKQSEEYKNSGKAVPPEVLKPLTTFEVQYSEYPGSNVLPKLPEKSTDALEFNQFKAAVEKGAGQVNELYQNMHNDRTERRKSMKEQDKRMQDAIRDLWNDNIATQDEDFNQRRRAVNTDVIRNSPVYKPGYHESVEEIYDIMESFDTSLVSYVEAVQAFEEKKYDYITDPKAINENIEKFKKDFNFRPVNLPGANPKYHGIITVRGKDYGADMDVDSKYVTYPAKLFKQGGKMPRQMQALYMLNPKGDQVGKMEKDYKDFKQILHEPESAPADSFARKTSEYGSVIVFDKRFFMLKREEQMPLLYHEIGHLRLQGADRSQSFVGKQNEAHAKFRGFGKYLIHGDPDSEIEADIYAANLSSDKNFMKSLKAYENLVLKTECYDKYIKGALSGKNEYYGSAIDSCNTILANVDKYYEVYANAQEAYNNALKSGNKDAQEITKKMLEKWCDFLKIPVHSMPMAPISKERFVSIVRANKGQTSFPVRFANLLKYLFVILNNWIYYAIERHERNKYVKQGLKDKNSPYNGYESVDEEDWLTEEVCNDLGIDYYDEKQHSNLNFDHRLAIDTDTGHKLHVVYSTDGMILTQNNVVGQNDRQTAKGKLGPEGVKELKKLSNTDHESYNQKVLAIIDMETGENIKNREVNVRGPFGVHNDKPSTIKVGEVDMTPRFKSTYWNPNTDTYSISNRETIGRMRGVKGRQLDLMSPEHNVTREAETRAMSSKLDMAKDIEKEPENFLRQDANKALRTINKKLDQAESYLDMDKKYFADDPEFAEDVRKDQGEVQKFKNFKNTIEKALNANDIPKLRKALIEYKSYEINNFQNPKGKRLMMSNRRSKDEFYDEESVIFDPFNESDNPEPEYNTDMSEAEAKRTLATLSQSIINDVNSKKNYKITQYTADIYANIISKNLLPIWAKGYRRVKITLDSYQSMFTLEFKIPKMTQDFVSRFVEGRESINGLLHREPEIRIKMSPRIFHTMKNKDDAYNFFKAAIKYYDSGINVYTDKILQAIHGMNREMKRLVSTTKLSGLVTMPIQMVLSFNDVNMSNRDTFKIKGEDIKAITSFIKGIYSNYASPEKEKAKILSDLDSMIQTMREQCWFDDNIRGCVHFVEGVKELYHGDMDDALRFANDEFIDEAVDKDWLYKNTDPKIKYLQEAFFVKKLKKLPSDLVSYISIETECIKTENDKLMLASYTISKIDIVEWYLELLRSGSKKYIVPHSEPYLVNLRTQLLQCYKNIMAVKIPKSTEPSRIPPNYEY